MMIAGKQIKVLSLFIGLFLLSICGACSGMEKTIADKGKTAYRIVIPAGTDVSTKAVAGDFAGILKEITGADFAVVTDETEPAAHEIIIGADNARLKKLGLSDMTKDFAAGEYEIRTVGNKLVIAGGPNRGTINGMYGFLQDHLGCKWFTPGCMKMPKQATLKLGDIRDRQKPSFIWRSTDACMHWDSAWTARNRLNECKTGGGIISMNMLMSDDRVKTIGNYASGHAMSYIPKSLFKTHPEYYSMVGGKRVCQEDPNYRGYCMTNDGLVEYMAGVLKRQLRGHENERWFVGLGHVDMTCPCQCEKCKASYDRLGISGTYMAFNNKVAELVIKEYPQAVITTMAYGVAYSPPKRKMKVHPNIRVVWCPINACYAHGFDECDANLDRNLIRDLAKWQEITSRLGIWYYHFQFDALMPHMKMRAAAGNFKKFREMGVKSIFDQYNCNATRRDNAAFDGDKLMPAYGNAKHKGYFTVPFGLQHLSSYLVCRLLWNADYDWKEGLREFCDTYYGPAGKEMAQFALMVEDVNSYEKTMGTTYVSYPGVHQSLSIAPKPKPQALKKMDELFEIAIKKVAGDKTLTRRVEMARTSVDLAIMVFTGKNTDFRQQAFNRFFPLMEELGLKRIKRTVVSWSPKSLVEFKELMSHPEKLVIPGEEPIGANILKNSSFENAIMGSTGVPDDWTAEGTYLPENYTVNPKGIANDTVKKAYTGKSCVRLTKSPKKGSIVSLRQCFDAEPGTMYRAKVHYQSKVKTGGVYMIFTAFDKNGKWLRHSGGTRGIKQTGDKWLELSATTKCQDDTALLMVEFFFYNDMSEGTAWIDDFECAAMEKQNK